MLNEFFNELAYNPGHGKGGFLFFLDWANHDLNSVVSTADANGPIGRSLIYFNCKILGILNGVREINPTVNLLVGLLRPPTKRNARARDCRPEQPPTTPTRRAVPKPASPLASLSPTLLGTVDCEQRSRGAEVQKRAPTLGNILVIILFVLSCFGLLMFLWGSFGGPLPLKPKGYRFAIVLPAGLRAREQSDVRISGVDVGHVISLSGRTRRAHRTRRSKSRTSTRRSGRTRRRSCG